MQQETGIDLDQYASQHARLSIVKLSEPILAANSNADEAHDEKRVSIASSAADGSGNPTPASLGADLKHYQELFTKLRFSYVEQVTKEKFLRAVVGDPPLFVEQADNIAFEAELQEVKASLKAQKLEVADTIKELEMQGRDLSQRYKVTELQLEQLRNLPSEVASLQETLDVLRSHQSPQSTDPSMSLPLPATSALLAEKQTEIDDLDQQLEVLQAECESQACIRGEAEASLKPLQAQKVRAINEAKEARKRKDMGVNGLGDELEEKGRWLNGVNMMMNKMLNVES